MQERELSLLAAVVLAFSIQKAESKQASNANTPVLEGVAVAG
jgi:hypothetical protein